MKVALCIFGHFRCFDKCKQNLLNNILNVYQPDVFAQAWVDSTGVFLHPEHTPNPFDHKGYDPASPKPSLGYIKEVIDFINPVDIQLDHYYLHDQRFANIVDKYKEYKSSNPLHRPKGTLSQNWARHSCIAMKKQYELQHNFKYDYVIVSRWDNQHYAPPILDNFNPDMLACPNTHQIDNLIGDICVISGSDIINVLGDQFYSIDQLAQTGKFNFNAHTWMAEWLDYNNIVWEYRADMHVWTDR